MIRKVILFLFLFISKFLFANAELIVYSYNRPLQLYALLESVERYMTGLQCITVFYKADAEYEQGYAIVQTSYPSVYFCRESSQKVKDILCANNPAYILFAPDDLLVKAPVDIATCVKVLERTNAYAFLLRLGLHITRCHVARQNTPVPRYSLVEQDIYSYVFEEGSGDWCFAHNVDMTLYRKKDIVHDLLKLNLTTPHFEGIWARTAPLSKQGLFFARAKVVNVLINLVNPYSSVEQFSTGWRTRMWEYSSDQLLKLFYQGLKLDLASFYQIEHDAPHIEYPFTFIKR